MKIKIEKINLPYKTPFVITGYTFTGADTVRVTLVDECSAGSGEAYAMGETALGIFYEGETMDSMAAQLEGIADEVAEGITHDALQELLPYGGARNALDCALWDLEAKRSGRSIWQLLDLTPKPLKTVSTLGIDTPEKMEVLMNLALIATSIKPPSGAMMSLTSNSKNVVVIEGACCQWQQCLTGEASTILITLFFHPFYSVAG